MNNTTLDHLATQLYWQLPPNSNMREEGERTTALHNVTLFYQEHIDNSIKESAIYGPRMVFLFSGAKYGELGQRRFHYDVDHFLILTSYYPIQCTTHCLENEKILGIFIDLDRAMVAQLLANIKKNQKFATIEDNQHETINTGLACYPINNTLREQLWILLRTLLDPIASSLFGQDNVRALLYAFIQTSGQDFFQAWTQHNSQFAQFQHVIEYIGEHFSKNISVQVLADHAAMSTSSLNRAFKKYMSDTPLQYLKKIRLNKAKVLIMQNKLTITQVAQAVGYESASQFNREFKRYFGVTPKKIGSSIS